MTANVDDATDRRTGVGAVDVQTALHNPKSSDERDPRLGFQARLAESRDREAIKAMLRQHHARTVFRAQAFSETRVDRMLDKVLSRPDGMAGIVAEHEGEVTGIAWAQSSEYLLTEGPRFVTVHLIAVNRTMGPVRRAKTFLTLVAAIRQWAASEQASPVFFHVMTGSNLAATDRLMKAAGAQCVGGNYVV